MQAKAQRIFSQRAVRSKRFAPQLAVAWRAAVAALRLGALAFLLAGPSAALTTEARAQAIQEYDLKAVLLYNFTQFVEWPPDVFTRPDAPWVIGILGRDPFGKVLDNVVGTELHQGRRIVVERYHSIEAMRDCHILFISGSEADNLPRILSAIRNRPILSVSDIDGFGLKGGVIRFKKSPAGKIQLRINLPAARDAHLTVSAKLLRVAEVISDPLIVP